MKKYFFVKLFNLLKFILNNIENENLISPKSTCKIHPSVKQSATHIDGKIIINENSSIHKCKFRGEVSIGRSAKISNANLSGGITVGNYSRVIDGVELHGTIEIGTNTTINGPNTDLRAWINNISIGSFCSIARNVTFQEYYHDYTRLTTYMVKKHLEGKPAREDIISKGSIEIGHDVWIGTHCVILSGSKIGTGAVIAANSVVTGEIPPYAIAAGSPARIIKYRFNDDTIKSLLESEWWTKEHAEIVQLYNSFKGS